MRPVTRGIVPTHITESGREQQNLSQTYGFFLFDLVKRLGEYCSYCEVPLGANLAVEHIISKSVDPNLENEWTNLLLACTNCNSRKLNKVTGANRANYYWPSDENTFAKLRYSKSDKNGVTMAWVEAADPNDNRATETINLMALNNVNTNDPKVSDRRVVNRTTAWDRAVQMASKLETYYVPYNGTGNDATALVNANQNPAIRLLKRQISAAAVATGFWSVWMTVFGANTRTFINQNVREDLRTQLFVRPFPGTNYPYQ